MTRPADEARERIRDTIRHHIRRLAAETARPVLDLKDGSTQHSLAVILADEVLAVIAARPGVEVRQDDQGEWRLDTVEPSGFGCETCTVTVHGDGAVVHEERCTIQMYREEQARLRVRLAELEARSALKVELVEFVGGHGDLVSVQSTRLHRMIVKALQRCIGDHGEPITRKLIGSAAKRIAVDVRNAVLSRLDESQNENHLPSLRR